MRDAGAMGRVLWLYSEGARVVSRFLAFRGRVEGREETGVLM